MDQKPCIRCERVIDAHSKACPFCNWDQGIAYTPDKEPIVNVVPPPREEQKWKKYAMIAGGVVVMLVASFLLGLVINQDGTPKNVPESKLTEAERQNALAPIKRADTPLVAVGAGSMEEVPITTAPVATPNGSLDTTVRTDATAVSAAEYAQLAARARAERQNGAVVDPRSITGAAYAGGVPAPAAPAPRQRTLAARRSLPSAGSAPAAPAAAPATSSARTRPVPEYQPIPRLRAVGTARLELIVGADGRVKDVNVIEGVPGETPRLIAAVQSWKFRPATLNGSPVEAPFSVDISFNGSDY
jgi:TonB family protein